MRQDGQEGMGSGEMTVGELREILSHWPDGMDVVACWDSDYPDIESVDPDAVNRMLSLSVGLYASYSQRKREEAK